MTQPRPSKVRAAVRGHMHDIKTTSILCASATLLVGCAAVMQPACSPGQQRQVNDLLYFGTAKPSGVVSRAEWSAFLDRSVTPRFPQGSSVWQAAGQWQSADGSLVRETSFVLALIHPESAAAEQAIHSIVSEYKTRFQQESVLRVTSAVCVSF